MPAPVRPIQMRPWLAAGSVLAAARYPAPAPVRQIHTAYVYMVVRIPDELSSAIVPWSKL